MNYNYEKCMLDFKSLQLTDKKIIDTCLDGNTYRACDFNFTNLYSWQSKFETTFTIEQDTLFIRYREADDKFCYLMPIGKMPLEKSLNRVLEDVKMRNTSFLMKGVTRRMWVDIMRAMPDTFECEHDRANDEYIYLSERLINLTGKKLQSKRNHINRFKKDNPDWAYISLTSRNELNECAAMLDEWEDMNVDKAQTSLRYDYIATRIMLDNFEYLGLCGGAIKVNGKIVAFTLGERLTEDTFVIHVEKAFADMNGAYTIINQQFVEHEAGGYKYINREEDMGLEYLRKAKMSYYPDILLQERVLTLKK